MSVYFRCATHDPAGSHTLGDLNPARSEVDPIGAPARAVVGQVLCDQREGLETRGRSNARQATERGEEEGRLRLMLRFGLIALAISLVAMIGTVGNGILLVREGRSIGRKKR